MWIRMRIRLIRSTGDSDHSFPDSEICWSKHVKLYGWTFFFLQKSPDSREGRLSYKRCIYSKENIQHLTTIHFFTFLHFFIFPILITIHFFTFLHFFIFPIWIRIQQTKTNVDHADPDPGAWHRNKVWGMTILFIQLLVQGGILKGCFDRSSSYVFLWTCQWHFFSGKLLAGLNALHSEIILYTHQKDTKPYGL